MKILNSFLQMLALLFLTSTAWGQAPPCYPPVGQNVKLHKDPLQQTIPVSYWCPPTEPYMDWTSVLGVMRLSALTAADQQAIIPAVMNDDKLTMVTLIGKSLVVDSTEWKAVRTRVAAEIRATEPPVYDTVTVGGQAWEVGDGKRLKQMANFVLPGVRAACRKLMITESNGDVWCAWRQDPAPSFENLVVLVKRLPR
jgi:hypothetical protein